MSITRANFGYLLEPTLRNIYADEFKQYKPYIGKVFNVDSMSKQTETDLNTTGIGYMTERNENAPLTYTDPLQGYKTVYTTKEYNAATKVSWCLLRDDTSRTIKDQFRNLSRAAVRSPDKNGFSVFRNGFDTSYTSYGDGKPLFSTSHPRKDGGTAQSNASSTSVALTEASLNVGILAKQQILDDKGNLIDNGGHTMLMIPPALRKTAEEIIGSKLRSGTGDNDLNYYKISGDLSILVNPWISAKVIADGDGAAGSDTAWYLIGKNHKLNFLWRERPSFDKERDFETDQWKFKVIASWCHGWSDWRDVWASKGDTSDYSS